MEQALIDDVRLSGAYYNVTSAVMSGYEFPELLATSNQEKRAAENDIAIAQNEREGALVEANTVLLTAQIEAESLEIEADAEEESILAEAAAQSEAIQSVWHNRMIVYSEIMNSTKMDIE